MDHIASVRAAVRAVAPIVAIPIEGRAPVCVKAKLLKGALKGVTIHSVELLENRCLRIKGMAGFVHTSCTIVPVERWKALQEIREWTIKEREKRIRRINQGVLAPAAQKELKRQAMEKAEAKELAQALSQAHAELIRIREKVKEHFNPITYPIADRERKELESIYRELRNPCRKRGSVLRHKIKELRAQAEAMTVKRKEPRKAAITALRRGTKAGDLLGILQQIGALEAQYKALYPPVWKPNPYAYGREPAGRWEDSFTVKRPKEDDKWYHWDRYDRTELARQLGSAKLSVLALTPPEDKPEDMPVAA